MNILDTMADQQRKTLNFRFKLDGTLTVKKIVIPVTPSNIEMVNFLFFLNLIDFFFFHFL